MAPIPIVLTELDEMIEIELTTVFVCKCLYGTPTQLLYNNVSLPVHHYVTHYVTGNPSAVRTSDINVLLLKDNF